MVHMAKDDIAQMRIKRIEKEIRDTPYHKGTEHHIGRLRARLSKLKDDLEPRSGKGGGAEGYAVKKQGDATIVLVGPPSVGKSTLINKLTNANSKIAPYAFTTVSVIPGMMVYKNARIQILDVPGLIKGAEEGKGRGREVLSVVRGCDLLVIMTDTQNIDALDRLYTVLERNGIRPDKAKPDVVIKKKLGGGIIIHSNIHQDISKETIKGVIEEMGLKNGEVTINEKVTIEALIDTLARNRVYVPTLKIINKADTEDIRYHVSKHGNRDAIAISAEKGVGLDTLKEAVWEKLGFISIYLVGMDEEPGFNNPLITKSDKTLADIAAVIGNDFAEGKTRAKIWASGAKFPGQDVSLKTKVQEGMQVRFI